MAPRLQILWKWKYRCHRAGPTGREALPDMDGGSPSVAGKAVEAAALDRLGDVRTVDPFAAVQVRDGSRDFEDAVVTAR